MRPSATRIRGFARSSISILADLVSSPAEIQQAYTSTIHEPAMLTFVLLILPREIRDEIYGHLLLCGDLAIMRSSRQINLEAMNLLYRMAVYRMVFNYDERSRNIQPSQEAVVQIQNLSLQFQLPDLTSICHANEINVSCSH